MPPGIRLSTSEACRTTTTDRGVPGRVEEVVVRRPGPLIEDRVNRAARTPQAPNTGEYRNDRSRPYQPSAGGGPRYDTECTAIDSTASISSATSIAPELGGVRRRWWPQGDSAITGARDAHVEEADRRPEAASAPPRLPMLPATRVTCTAMTRPRPSVRTRATPLGCRRS